MHKYKLLAIALGVTAVFVPYAPIRGEIEGELMADNHSVITPQPPNVTEIKRIARELQVTFVEYSLSEDRLLIWVVRPTGKIAARQVELQENLNALVRDTHSSISQSSPEAMSQLQQLHKILIDPITSFLPANPTERVVFIPKDMLFLVPFAALLDEEEKYLIDRHTISLAPSIQALDLLHQRSQAVAGTNERILIVGNPSPIHKYVALPGTEREALNIASLYDSTALISAEATKKQVVEQMSQARFIHLATNISEDSSAIVLAAEDNVTGESADYLLTATEILDLNLQAELVVLSGCNSALGKITAEGVIGLGRAFLGAGVPSFLGSLWYVSDETTIGLMTEFHRQLQQNPNKAAALRQAMLETKEKHPHPFDWASFRLIGAT